MDWNLLKEANQNKRLNIAVIGDYLSDEYHLLKSTRPACEAIIPIYEEAEKRTKPGGAGNVAEQLRHWNAKCHLLTPKQFNLEEIIPIKHRYYHGDQLLFRIDDDKKHTRSMDLSAHRKNLFNHLCNLLDDLDVVILSDYGKGLFAAPQLLQDIIHACKQFNVLTIADPHNGTPPQHFEGVYAFKPNEDYYKSFHVNPSAFNRLVITRGSLLPICYINGELIEAFKYECQQRPQIAVKSVIGAGDCFTAHLAVALGHKTDFLNACEFANCASRLYVQELFNEPVKPQQLWQELGLKQDKIVEARDLPKGKEITFTNGCFDLLHSGHIDFLQRAKALGGKLVVAVNSDRSVSELKGNTRPIISQRQRMEALAALECVDYVVLMDDLTPYRLLEEIKPNILVKGDSTKVIIGREVVEKCGGRVLLLPQQINQSTTQIIERIKTVCFLGNEI